MVRIAIFILVKLLFSTLVGLFFVHAALAQADSLSRTENDWMEDVKVATYVLPLLDSNLPAPRMDNISSNLSLYLHRKGRYIMKVWVWGHSEWCVQGMEYGISCGTYTWQGKRLRLYDEMLQAEWAFRAKGKQLVPVKSFPQRFTGYYDYYMHESEFQCTSVKPDYNRCHAVEHAGSGNISGMYRLPSGYADGLCFYFLFRDNNYEFYYDKKLLLKGTWKWENGKLRLDDKLMQTYFVLALDKDGSLAPERFIGDFCRFYKKQ